MLSVTLTCLRWFDLLLYEAGRDLVVRNSLTLILPFPSNSLIGPVGKKQATESFLLNQGSFSSNINSYPHSYCFVNTAAK